MQFSYLVFHCFSFFVLIDERQTRINEKHKQQQTRCLTSSQHRTETPGYSRTDTDAVASGTDLSTGIADIITARQSNESHPIEISGQSALL